MRNLLLILALAAGTEAKTTPAEPLAQSTPPATVKPAQDPAHPGGRKADPHTTATPAEAIQGKVLERLDASPYCYLRLGTTKGEVWAAVPEGAIEKGMVVTVVNPMQMGAFESKTLKRTFPEIYFGTLAPAGTQPPNPHHASQKSAQAVPVGKVPKAQGPQSRTVAEVWSRKRQLNEKLVTVRGKVVKFNQGVLGRNWIHLQDGSGSPKKGTHDLTFTTLSKAAVGDLITLKGMVRINRDLGSGYFYEVLVEDAALIEN